MLKNAWTSACNFVGKYQKASCRSYEVIFFVCAMLEILVCGAIIFGWANLTEIFTHERLYWHLCNTSIPFTHQSAQRGCLEQSKAFSLVFTVASSALSLIQLPIGCFIDKWGAKLASAVGGAIYLLAVMTLSLITPGYENLLIPVLAGITVGGSVLSVSLYQASNIIYTKKRSMVMCCLNGAFDSSAVMLFVIKVIYEHGFSYHSVFHSYFWLSFLLIVCSVVFLIPSHNTLLKWNDAMPAVNKINSLIKEECHDASESSVLNVTDKFDNSESSLTTKLVKEAPDSARTRDSMKTWLFWLSTATVSIISLKLVNFVGVLSDNLERLTQDDEHQMNYYLAWFGYVQLSGILVTPFVGAIYQKLRYKENDDEDPSHVRSMQIKSCLTPYLLTNALCVLMCVLDTLDDLRFQIPVYILCTVVRGFVFANHATLIAIAFPADQFGTLFGVSSFVMGLSLLAHYGLFHFTFSVNNGDPTTTNIILLVLVSATNVHSLYVYFSTRNKTATDVQRTSIE